jgi:formate hydrogenlyase subunit 3/multisubunit Na+/H+ antiporter MnhD subunit
MLAALSLLVEPLLNLSLPMPSLTWMTLEDISVVLIPALDLGSLGLGFALLSGGALALLALALALVPAVRGFGGLFAQATLALAAALLSIVANSSGLSHILPFAWALAALLSYGAVRSSGALNQSETLPQGLALGLLASLLLLSGLLVAPQLSNSRVDDALGSFGHTLTLACTLIATLALVGIAPLHGAFDETVAAPAALGGLLHGLVFPILALGSLIQRVEMLTPLPEVWRITLIVTGLLGLLIASAASLREHSLRRLLGWQVSAQAGGVVFALGLTGPFATIAAPALLLNLMLATLAGTLAVAMLERLAGSDDFTQIQFSAGLKFAGAGWLLAAASSLGLPPLWGFWGRHWLLAAASEQAPWAIPPLLAATILAMLAYLGPLARFWRLEISQKKLVLLPPEGVGFGPWTPPAHVQRISLGIALVPLLLLGLAPQLAWNGWLQAAPGAAPALPVGANLQFVVIVIAVAGAALFFLVQRFAWTRRIPADDDMEPVILGPDALGSSVRSLAWLGRPEGFLRRAWDSLVIASNVARAAMAIFEQRFYLAGVLLALIVIMLLMAL